MKTDLQFWSDLSHFFFVWEMFQTNVVEKIKTHTFYVQYFFSEYRAICEIMWKIYSTTGRATDDSVAQAHCMLDN